MRDASMSGSEAPFQAGDDAPGVDTSRALREAEERYRSLVEHIPAITYVYEMDNAENTVFMSPQVEAILGYTPAEMLEDPNLWWDRLHPEDRERVIAETERFNNEGGSYQGEYRMIARDGTEVWIQDEARLLRDDQGKLERAQGVLIDISVRKHLEEQLRQSQRMEAVGRLAGGVAHDFNNLLAVIQNYARFLFEDLGDADPRREDAGEILAAGERATALVQQLLTFSRKEEVKLQVLDMNDVVLDMERLLKRSIGEDVRLETHLSGDLWPCEVDQGQMEQVIANLAVNARDAMPEGGCLTIETENVTHAEGWLTQYAGPAIERYVCVTVTDTGRGISDEDRDHIFDPFFTTKERGKGTGLGLAIVHGVVQGAGGHISVFANEDQGTTFKIYLPATHERVSEDPQSEIPVPKPVVGRGETIGVVEDEEVLRRLVERILTSRGYHVVALGPEEALELLGSDCKIDLLLTDVIMPVASGKEIADRVQARLPGCPVIYMSGYTDDIIARHRVTGDGSAFLQKPFTAEDLLATVLLALDRVRVRTD